MFKSKQTLWLVVSVTFNVAILSTLIYTWQQHPRRRWHQRRNAYEAQWSPEERTRIDSLREQFPQRIQSVRDSLSAERFRMADLMRVNLNDSISVYSHMARIAHWQAVFSQEVYHQILAENAALSPEHREEFVSAMIRRMTRLTRGSQRGRPNRRKTGQTQ